MCTVETDFSNNRTVEKISAYIVHTYTWISRDSPSIPLVQSNLNDRSLCLGTINIFSGQHLTRAKRLGSECTCLDSSGQLFEPPDFYTLMGSANGLTKQAFFKLKITFLKENT